MAGKVVRLDLFYVPKSSFRVNLIFDHCTNALYVSVSDVGHRHLIDRFTMISKQQRIPPTAQTVRVQMAAQRQASARNQRLALQMANRPSVQAELGNQQQVNRK